MPKYGLVNFEAKGVGGLLRGIDAAPRRAQNHINRTMRLLDAELAPIYKSAAPVDTGALRRSVGSAILFRGAKVRVTVTAAGFRDGFNYLRITREGHTSPYIYPRRAKFLKVHVDGRMSRPIRRKRVRGYQPMTDWVQDATKVAEKVVDAHVAKLGRDVKVNLLSSARAR